AVVAHTTICGGSAVPRDEAAARTRASENVSYPNNSSAAGSGALVPGSGADSEWAFYTAASDFGGVTVVSAVTNRTVFGGSIVWGGTGAVLYPETWSTSDIGVG